MKFIEGHTSSVTQFAKETGIEHCFGDRSR